MINKWSLPYFKRTIIVKYKHTAIFFIALILIFSQTASCFALGDVGKDNKIIADEEILSLIPPELEKYFKLENGLNAETVNSLDGEFFLSFVITAIQDTLSAAISLFLALLSIITITSTLNSFSSHLSPSINKALTFASSLCCALCLYSLLGKEISTIVSSVDSTNTLLSSIAPIISVIYTSSGKITEGTVAAANTLFTVSITEIMTHNILMPVLKICFSLEVISAISGKSQLSGVASTLKNTFLFISGGLMTVITAIFTYQTVIAESADNTILKTARFAMGSLPIVGGAVSEASRTLLGAFELVKNLTGGLGVCLILLIVIPPIVYLMISKVTLSLSKILASSLECPPVAAIIKGAEDILSFSIAILIIFDITAIFTLGVLLVISS